MKFLVPWSFFLLISLFLIAWLVAKSFIEFSTIFYVCIWTLIISDTHAAAVWMKFVCLTVTFLWRKFYVISHVQCLCLVVFELPVLSWRNMSCSALNQVAYLTSEATHQPEVWSEMTSVLSDRFTVSIPHHNTSTHNSAGSSSLFGRMLGLHLWENWIISSFWRLRVRKYPFRSGLRSQSEASSEAAKFYFSMLSIQHFPRLKEWRLRG